MPRFESLRRVSGGRLPALSGQRRGDRGQRHWWWVLFFRSTALRPRAARDSRRSALTLADPVTTHNNSMRPAVAIFMLTTATASATFCCGHSGTARAATATHVLLQEKSRSRTSVTPTSCDSAPASRSRVTAMVHTTDELQLAAAVVLPLLAYKVAAIVQRNQLQWYLDASIALATASLLVYAAS